MKKLIVIFIIATLIDAIMTIIGLHLGWHEEGSVIISKMITLTGSITWGVILPKVVLSCLVLSCINVVYKKRKGIAIIITIVAGILQTTAGLLWLA